MHTVTKTLYKYDELPTDEAKERARDWLRQDMDYAWSDEARQSIEAFCEHFGVNLIDWSVGPYSPIDYNTNAENEHFRGRKLRDFDRDYMPTGYCLDCDLWNTFYDRLKDTGDAKAAFDDALYAGFKSWRDDMEWQLSDKAIEESLIANEYEFDEDGNFA